MLPAMQPDLACMEAEAWVLLRAVDRVPEGEDWSYSTGFVNEDMVREHLFPAGPDTIAVMCGPPPMVKFACLPNLEKAGYASADCISF
jgi:NAD(P)H-flavin reductase